MSCSVIATGPEGEALQQVLYFYSARKEMFFLLPHNRLSDR